MSEKPAYVVVICKDSLEELKDSLEEKLELIYPFTFFISVDCPGWFTQYHMIASLLQGFTPVIACSKDVSKRCGGLDKVKKWADDLSVMTDVYIIEEIKDIVNVLKNKPKVKVLKDMPMLSQDRTAVFKLLRDYNVRKVSFSTPILGDVVVDEEKCLVCDACSNMCPFGALRIRDEGEKRLLEFSAERCAACNVCQEICPYNAISLRYEYLKEHDVEWRPVAEDKIARCKMCGRPIGSYKHLKAIERKLRESGADPWVIESLWLCQECKIKALIEGRIKRKGE
jgi:formate hydrogenlyase subunit 6/NADH:ubiquinone oxidoreductase subunit I